MEREPRASLHTQAHMLEYLVRASFHGERREEVVVHHHTPVVTVNHARERRMVTIDHMLRKKFSSA